MFGVAANMVIRRCLALGAGLGAVAVGALRLPLPLTAAETAALGASFVVAATRTRLDREQLLFQHAGWLRI